MLYVSEVEMHVTKSKPHKQMHIFKNHHNTMQLLSNEKVATLQHSLISKYFEGQVIC